MIAELSGSNMQPPDAQKIQSIIDELQLAARQYYLKKHEPPTAADTAVKHTQVAALFDLIMQELGMLKTLTTQALLRQRADSHASNYLQKALSLWKKRAGVQALLELGVINAEPQYDLNKSSRRHQLLEDEAQAVCGLTPNKFPQAQVQILMQVLRELHQTHQGAPFQADMLHCIQSAAENSRWSADNFAYGSTFFHGWLSIFEHPAVKPYVTAAMSDDRQFQVWGSSIGWLVFYAALTYGIEAVGYELLSCHVDTAQQLASCFQVPNVTFHAEDMLKSELGRTSILMLASFCWDRHLYKQATAKLCKELLQGSIVVDYSDHLDEHLQQIAKMQIPVSWNAQQIMYVYLKTKL